MRIIKLCKSLILCLSILSLNSCVDLLENINKEQTEVDKQLIESSYELSVSNSLEWDIGRIVTIVAKPEHWIKTYNAYQTKTTSIKTNYGYLLLSSALAAGGIYVIANSDSADAEAWALVGLFSAGVVISITKIGKSNSETKYLGKQKEKIETVTAKNRNAHLVFTIPDGKRIRIYLGKINNRNKLLVKLKDLVNSPEYKFKNEEEVYHYFTMGYIDIDWLPLNQGSKNYD